VLRTPQASSGNRRRQKTRRQLLDAAGAVIAERGIDNATVGEIAERADVAFGSFYNHFASKEEIVEVLLAEIVDRHAEASVAIDAVLVASTDRLARGVMALVHQALTDPLWGLLLVRLGTGRLELAAPLLGLVDRDVRAGQAVGELSADTDAGLLVVMISGAVYGAIYSVVSAQPGGPPALPASLAAEIRAAEVARSVLRLAGVTPSSARTAVARVQKRFPLSERLPPSTDPTRRGASS